MVVTVNLRCKYEKFKMALNPKYRVLQPANDLLALEVKYHNTCLLFFACSWIFFYCILVTENDMFCLNAFFFNRCSRILASNVFLSPSALLILLAEVSTAGHVTSGVGELWSHIFNSNMSFCLRKDKDSF